MPLKKRKINRKTLFVLVPVALLGGGYLYWKNDAPPMNRFAMLDGAGVIYSDLQHRRQAVVTSTAPGFVNLTLNDSARDGNSSKDSPLVGALHWSAGITMKQETGWFACFDEKGNLQFGTPGGTIQESAPPAHPGEASGAFRILTPEQAAPITERIARERKKK